MHNRASMVDVNWGIEAGLETLELLGPLGNRASAQPVKASSPLPPSESRQEAGSREEG